MTTALPLRKGSPGLRTRLAIGALALAPMLSAQISIQHLSTYATGSYNTSAAEIVSFDPSSDRIFFVNAQLNQVVALDASDPAAPVLDYTIDMAAYGALANSVTVLPNGIAVAAEASPKTSPGKVVFFTSEGTFISQVTVGALPDMVTVTPDGTKVLVANEGEPNDSYTIDPVGSISIIDISGGLAGVTGANVTTLDFSAYTPAMLPGVRIFGQGASVAQDMEPEYITVSADSQKAFVVCQENNAVARIDLATNTFEQVVSLGMKDHSLPGNGLDASDNPANINIATWPVKGLYMPDAIDSYTVGGQTYVVYANEGDAREWGSFVEPRRIGNAGYVLDPTVFPNAATLKQNANLGRLNATIFSGDTDNDGDFDEIHVFGSRSFTIRDANGAVVWDSGDRFEQITAAQYPTNFNSNNSGNGTFDNRSDDKGPEPEAVVVAEVYGRTYAFIGLERIGGIMVYDVTVPTAPEFIQYLNHRNFVGTANNGTALDLGIECITFVSAVDSPDGKPFLITGNEVSGTVSLFRIDPPPFQLQLLHASDFEAGVQAVDDAPRFAAIMDNLEDTYANTLKLSSGDNILPSPFLSSGEDPSLVNPLKAAYEHIYGGPFANNDLRAGIGRVDITIMNLLGIQASALGNHEFDLGTSELRNIIGGVNSGAAIRWFGAQFPYLSSNLDFSADPNLSSLYTNTIQEPSFFRSNPSQSAAAIAATKKLAPSTVIDVNGERIGIVGATTQILASISSPGATTVVGPDADDMAALAAIIQPVIDALRNDGIDKIIVLSHLQQLTLEKQLAPLLNGVDIIVAGGSHTLMADATDRMRAGDTAAETYPFLTNGLDGDPVAIVNTTSEYQYVGRLVVDFDADGKIVPASIDPAISGAYAADSLGVVEVWGDYASAFTPGSKGEQVRNLCNAVESVIIAKDGDLYGKTDVFLEGRRNFVRTEETNLGNLSADANLWLARRYDASVRVSIKNGGGIRSAIGQVNAVGDVVTLDPPAANPAAGKELGDISRLDIENSLRFNNQLTNLTLTAQGLRAILEHGVAASGPGQTQGRFPQVSGVRFSYDETLPAGARLLNAVITDTLGTTVDTLVMAGQLHGDPQRTFRVVTLNFLSTGGDGYPFNVHGTGLVDLNTLPEQGPAQAAFTNAGSEQDAFAEYMLAFHGTTPFGILDTPASLDRRIEEIHDREDDILPPVVGCDGHEVTVSITTDANGGQITWTIVDEFGMTVATGGPYTGQDNTTVNTTVCLPSTFGDCYRLRLTDNFGDGITGGGWEVRDGNGAVVLKDSFSSGLYSPRLAPQTSVYGQGHAFCLPLGPSNIDAANCGVFTNIRQSKVYCTEVPGATTYQFEFSDPDAGFYRRIALPRNWVRFSEMYTSPLLPGVVYFARARVDQGLAGFADDHFGPGCELGLTAQTNCTALIDNPGSNTHSCGVTRTFGGSSKIWAQPVNGATMYRFRFTNAAAGFARTIDRPSYVCALNWITLPLVNGTTYTVDVEVLVGGVWSGYCGPTCELTIGNAPARPELRVAEASATTGIRLFPNPNNGERVTLIASGLDSEATTATVTLVDLRGTVIGTRTIPSGEGAINTVLDLQGLASGVYLVRLSDGTQDHLQRLVIQR